MPPNIVVIKLIHTEAQLPCYFLLVGEGIGNRKQISNIPSKLPIIAFGTGLKGENPVKFEGYRKGSVVFFTEK
ncbi:hypothetical protein PHYBLDRAFT_153492 [Phycomyces blakesleeanus NRRL 1555(-)]|uniref:Uncharacterized protein n=1 Tax=Phycomyces blakesleeanus (strain ATCC 8743b / DSM 1359 / FGSC 10004 / NBRC 33097 / NRRL 1555) TaxID=763407 RepID=A0A167J7P3_PHYB8|nr:hypothetical protein PHYBLDRAFT_153492 [Phycomyces blakesleeanus NRRL 1555(-)]OAD65408.1 hypothetical protein PHYBLDRAFT_153492 [Phycomyces blakesleeanus NRRL 1555(-)]|eukprot:XP_018283448.1 hypothetical protein PHYBLDRAFT_153492 [Phycomyces blakesleeanus NRRL 1555(-)]